MREGLQLRPAPRPRCPRLLRPGGPLARRPPGVCSPRAGPRHRQGRPSGPLLPSSARTSPRPAPARGRGPRGLPDAARWLGAVDVITLSAARAPDFVSICRKEVIEVIEEKPRDFPGWVVPVDPPGRCGALLRRGSRSPPQRSLQEKAPCRVFWKTSSQKENSTPDYPYKGL
ncbi:unnamed protein product [Nyctereutes procyonoides]|uniref:(raccoon dog) hypothetical protein n=1 Tax=Nyctereutes procyonoides TaxID=34880 RepID=A0A811YST7_NYCPR|nr:unnamed protein product [Nyctereutes procyonoides]